MEAVRVSGIPRTRGRSAAWTASARIGLATLAACGTLVAACVDSPARSRGTGEENASVATSAGSLRPTMIDSYGRVVRARCVPAVDRASCVGVEYSPPPIFGTDGGDGDNGTGGDGSGVLAVLRHAETFPRAAMWLDRWTSPARLAPAARRRVGDRAGLARREGRPPATRDGRGAPRVDPPMAGVERPAEAIRVTRACAA